MEYEKGTEVVDMCKAISDLRRISKNEAREEMVKNMLQDGKLSMDEIASYSKLPLSRIKELSNEIKVTA